MLKIFHTAADLIYTDFSTMCMLLINFYSTFKKSKRTVRENVTDFISTAIKLITCCLPIKLVKPKIFFFL